MVEWRVDQMAKTPTFSTFIRRYYAFHWFSDEWSQKQKWLYVALYVTLFNIGLIPFLVISEKKGLLVEGSLHSLGTLLLLFLVWFAIYQPTVNYFVAGD